MIIPKFLTILIISSVANAAYFKANFVATNDPTMPNAKVSGVVYVRWDSASSGNNRMLTQYTSPSAVNELIVQSSQIRYRYCTGRCDAETYKIKVQPPVTSGYTSSSSITYSGKACTSYTKSASNDDEVKQAIFCSGVLSRWVFKNGRTWDFTGQSTASFSSPGVPGGCPSPRCTRLIDLLINIDDSGSISSSEWKTLVSYVNTIIGKFEVANDATMVGVTFFINTGRKISGLTGSASSAKKAISNASRKWGNTCVGAGVRVGFNEVLYKRSAAREALKPKRMVISITDGVDTQCSSNNKASKVMKDFGSKATFIAVGVGNGVTKSNLQKIASGSSYVIQSGSFSKLTETINKLVSTTCQDMPAMNPCGNSCKGFCTCARSCICPGCYQPTHCTVVSCSNAAVGCTKSARTCTNTNKCKQNMGCQEAKGGCYIPDIPEPAESANDKCKDGHCDPVKRGWYWVEHYCAPHAPDPVCVLTACDPKKGCYTYPRNCDDGNWCTNDTCVPNVGCRHTPVVCDDKNACTDDHCDMSNGRCVFTPFNIKERCNDRNACTHDLCEPKNGCYHEPVNCKGDDPCVLYKCDAKSTNETGCYEQRISGCGPGCNIQCDNSNLCRPQFPVKDEKTGECYCHVADEVTCDDGNNCTMDRCVPETGICEYTHKVMPLTNSCFTVSCNPVDGEPIYTPKDVCGHPNGCRIGKCVPIDDETFTCDYTNACNVSEDKCNVVQCVPSTDDPYDVECKESKIICDDPSPCVEGKCDSDTGLCVYTPRDVPGPDDPNVDLKEDFCHNLFCDNERGWYVEDVICENADPCAKVVCDAEQGKCVSSLPCEDHNYCTLDSCLILEETTEKPEDFDTENWTYTYKPVNETTSDMLLTYHKIVCQYVIRDPPAGLMDGYGDCFEPVCVPETMDWTRKVLDEAFTDPCGGCIADYDQYLEGSVTSDVCFAGITKNEFNSALGGTAIAAVIIAAIIGAAVVAVSGVFGTKELIERTAMAAGQSVQNNPFYKGNENEMVNPTFEGDDGFNY